MTIRSSDYIIFNGTDSRDLNISNVNLSGGLQEDPFLPETQILEVSTRYRDKPYFQDVKRLPQTFPITLLFDEGFNEESLRELGKLLHKNVYLPLIFSSRLDRIYYVIFEGLSSLNHNCLDQGYVTLSVRTNSPYAYKPFVVTDVYDAIEGNAWSSEQGQLFSTEFQSTEEYEGEEPASILIGDLIGAPPYGFYLPLENTGDLPIYFEIMIQKKDEVGEVSITNVTDNNKEFKIENLVVDEEIYVDFENENIITDLALTYRYDDWNGVALQLLPGVNEFTVQGKCHLRIRFQPILVA